MAKITFTKNTFTPLNQTEFKKVCVWRVEETQRKYAKNIRSYDYQIFALTMLKLKLNKNGSIPKNLNRAFEIKGAKIDERYLKEYARVSYILDNKYRFYIRYVESYGSKYINVSILPCDAQGYTHGECYEHSLYLREELVNEQDFNERIEKEINSLREYQKGDIALLKAIPSVAKQIEKLDLKGLYATTVQKWF